MPVDYQGFDELVGKMAQAIYDYKKRVGPSENTLITVFTALSYVNALISDEDAMERVVHKTREQ